MLRHAYLIIAHNEFEVLRHLLAALDDVRNDIYIHFDKKVKNIPTVHTVNSRLFILEKRVDVRWGDVSQIKTELLLFETAFRNGPYEYYHLISGTHLPLKDQNEIHRFFDEHKGNEVMRLWKLDEWEVDVKVRRRSLMVRWNQSPISVLRYISQLTFTVAQRLQRVVGYKRYADCRFTKSDNWISITERATAFLVNNKGLILRKYSQTFCADEFFAASELINNDFKIFDYDKLLYVRFGPPKPVTFQLSELPRLMETGYLFARKFTASE